MGIPVEIGEVTALAATADKVRVTISRKGLLAILKGPEVGKLIESTGKRVQAAAPTSAGETWDLTVRTGFDRPSAVIKTGNTKARESVANNPQAFYAALSAGR